MEFTKIKAYHNGTFVCEKVYSKSKNEAIDAFRKYEPEFKNCIVIAESYDPVANYNHCKKVFL